MSEPKHPLIDGGVAHASFYDFPDIAKSGLTVVGDIHVTRIDVDGVLTSWNIDPATGKESRKKRRFIGNLLDL